MTTRFVFTPGKLAIVMDGGAGSSGKGKLGSFICEHADNWQFACNTFMPQAGHWVKLDDGRSYFYQTFNSCAYLTDRYEKLYLGPGATIELPAFFRELEENNIPPHKIGISPVTAILQDIDGGFEKGTHGFDGKLLTGPTGGYLAKTGTTAHGCGANRARRTLRRPEAKYARDLPELKEFICNVPGEIMDRLNAGQAGLLEVAQGFQLSYMLPDMYPFCTSRNCTVAAGLDDLMVPPFYAGNVILNFRTFPIRINSNKYVDKTNGRHLTWPEYNDYRASLERLLASKQHGKLPSPDELTAAVAERVAVVVGNSGPGYTDQYETSWEEVTANSGAPQPIMEMTSVTKLPRRVFTFSRQNVADAIRHNRAGGATWLALNFVNYVDHDLAGKRAQAGLLTPALVGPKLTAWLERYDMCLRQLRFLGTGAKTDDMILIGD